MADKYWWEKEEKKDSSQQTAGQQTSEQGYWWQDLGKTVGTNVASRVDTWLKNHNNYITNHQTRNKGRTYTLADDYVKDPNDWLITVSKQKKNFDAEADSILAYMDQYKGYLDADFMKSVQETLTSARGNQQIVLENATADSQWWRNFANEDEYKTAQRYDGYNKKYSGQKYEDIQKAFTLLEDGSEEKWWLEQKQYDLYQNDGNYKSKAMSGLKSFEAQKVVEKKEEDDKSWFDKALASFATTGDTTLPAANLTTVTAAYRDDTSYREPSDLWSEGEKLEFGYRYAEDPNKAYAYAEQVNNAYASYEKYLQQQEIQASATKNGWSGVAHTLGAIATAPLGLADYLDDVSEYAGRGTITQKGNITPFEYSQAATSGIANKLNAVDKNGVAQKVLPDWVPIMGGKGWGDVYSLGVSAANSMLSAYSLGGTGTLVNFIGQGGAAGVDDALSRGATPEQAIWYGTIVGTLEGLTEAIPAGDLMKVGSSSTLKNYLKKAVNQGFEELLEEGASSFFGNLADDLIMQDKSNFNRTVAELMAADKNLTKEEAEKKAFWQMANDLAFDAVGGFATGSTNAMTVGGINTAMDARKGNEANIKALEQYGDSTKELIQEGLESDPKSESYQLATKYQKQTQGKEGKDGKALSGFQIRNLVSANDAQIAVENYEEALPKATDRLNKLGETKDITKIAKLVAKRVSGQELTKSEKSTLARSQFGAQVAKEMTTPTVETQSGTKSYNVTYKSLTDRVGTEGRFNVSESGEATIRGTDKVFDFENSEVVAAGEGQMTFKTADGEEVYAGDIDWKDDSQSFLVSAVSDIENITPAAATDVMHNIVDKTKPLGPQLNGIDEAYNYGFHDYSVADLKAGMHTPDLTNAQMMSAYRLGQSARKISDVEADAPVVKMRTAWEAKLTAQQKTQQQKARFESNDVEVYFLSKEDGSVSKFDGNTDNYDDKRVTVIRATEFLSKMRLGGSGYYLFESYTNAAGERVFKDENGVERKAPNGIYRDKTGRIYIDLNAGEYGQGVGLFTLGHELTHFIKARSKAQFKTLCDLVTEAYSKTDMSMHERVLRKQKMLSDTRGEAVSYTDAYEEVVCDAMSTMISDGNFFEKVAEIKVKDRGLFETMKRFFKQMFDKFKKVYEELTPDQQDAQDIREMKAMFDKIQTAFAEALVEASDNFHAAMESVVETKAEPVAAEEVITEGAVVTDGEGERFSIRSMKADIAEGKMFEDLKYVCGWTDAQVNTLRNQLKDLVDYMIPYRNILDMNETYGREGRRFSPYKPNSDPLYKISMDFSTLCSKRLLTQYVIEQLQLRENRPMSAEEQMAIRDMLNEYRKVEKGLQVACAMCYVEAARLKSPKQMQRWLDDPAPLLKDYFGKKNKEFNDSVKKAQADFKESKGYDREAPKKDMKPADVKELNKIGPKMRSQYQMSAEEQAIVERAKELPNSTYLTAGNLADLSESDPVIYDAYTAFVRTATRSKSLEKDEPYYYGDSQRDNGNGIVVTDGFIEAVNRENGMRFSSWSDWRMQHLLDYITAVIDNSVRGAAMHGYTKFGDEVRVLGKTGMMFNMSGVAGTQTGLNEDGSLNFSPTESIDVNEAIQLRKEFPETAGLQCIGVSDDHIVALLRSDIIDYVIPYHVSGLNAALRRMANISGWADYTGTQHAAINKSIKLDNAVDKEHWHEEPVFSEFFVGYDTGMTGIEAMRASAEKYKQMCKDRGLTPKFNQFASEDNYWKLLIDRKMINQQTGNLIRQKAVTPTFDFDVIKSVVDKFVDNYDAGLEARALNHIVENWDTIPQRIKDLKKQGSTKAKQTKKAAATLANQTVAAQPKDDEKHSDRTNGFKEHDVVSAVYTIRNEKAQRGHDLVKIGSMPTLYRDLFELSGDVFVSNEHLYQNMVSRATAEAEGRFNADASADYHELGEEKVINAIDQFQDPLVIMESLKDFNEPRLVAVLDEKGNDGQNLMAVMELYAPKRPHGVSQLRNHVLITIYEKNSLPDYIEKTVDKGRILHKKEGSQLTSQAGLQLAGEMSSETLKKNVARFNKKVKDFKAKNNIKYSDRDSTGKQLSKNQQAFFVDSKVRDEKGNLLVMYHGSQNLGFAVFDPKASDDGRSFFFSDSPTVAASYSNSTDEVAPYIGANKARGLYRTYLNLKNPYVVDAKGSKWNNIVEFAEGDEFLGDIGSYLGIIRGMDSSIGIEDFLDSLRGDLVGSTEYAINDLHIDEETEESLFTEQEQKDLLELAERIDAAYTAWDESAHLDEDGESTGFESYVRENYTVKTTRKIASEAYKNGYDGVIFKNLVDVGKFGNIAQQNYEKSTVAVAFDSSQIKSVDNMNPTEDPDIRFSERTGESVSNRHLLAKAFEGISQNSVEYKMIQDYKGRVKELNELETKLNQLNAEIRKIRFGTEGVRDAQRLAQIEGEAKKIAQEINRYDKRLLNMEASEPLRKVIDRERKKEAQKTKDHVQQIQQNRKVRAEQTELRHKIRKAIRDLDKILNRGNKKLNVKEDMQNVVTKALKAADILFTDNYGTYDMLRNGIGADLSDAEEALVNTCTQMLKDLDKMPTDGYDNFMARQEAENRLKSKMSKLKDVFARERKRLNNTTVSSILGELADAYASLEKSEQSYVQGAYSEAVHNFLKSLQSEVGGTIVMDMTKDQLESVYAAYKMVLTAVRTANKMFNEELKMSREQLGNAVIAEVMRAGGEHGLWTKAEIARSQADWNNTKPIWVANRIGSETFGRLMNGLFKGQYNFAVDIDEAKQFKLSMDQKYHPRNWDKDKLYEFESSTGKKFTLNLQQIMSLYAFSKREQAYSHLLNGGFVFEGNSTMVVDKMGIKRTYIHNGATAYKLNEATLNEIIRSLTAEQKAYVDEMQKYLSEVMGAKGNEVSMKLYGIQMFKEKFYFPLRSSGAYMERAKEAELKKQQGQINLVNSGFTHAVVPEAKNPIILAGFMDVWAEHCNEMSMYHSMVLPMEDFRKVYNYSTVHDDRFDSASVYQTIQDAYGKAATDYIDQLYRELNAGATVDPRETPWKTRISKFKKAAVMLSASVVVQQFSAVGRAYALIDPKYFIGTRVKSGTNLSVADEMRKYAPVAIIKEMGGFDTGTKGSAKSYIMAEKYGKGERIKGVVKDEQYRSDLMGILPSKADEKTWCSIWEAVKRETRANHPKMDVKSEQFLKLAGDRFSEVIEQTQVYDSVLARSANMRSKGGLMQMATAFMAEPTTTINLLEDALRGRSVKKIARTFGAVAASIVLNNALASVVYAMRDDDEDETFIEKYFQSFASGMIDDINPMSYYPFLKDVYSLFQGYDVERADMSVIADLRDAAKKAFSAVQKYDPDMDDDELAEFCKSVSDSMMSLLDAVCSAFGVPVKNVRRDVNGILNAYNTIHTDLTERDTTWISFWDKVGAAVKDTIPIYAWTKDKAKQDKLYDAIMSGDKQYLARLKSGYKTDDAYASAVRKALRENDSRIHEAAQAKYDGNSTEYKRIFREIQKEGKFSFDDIMNAIISEESEIRKGLKGETDSSEYSATDFVNAMILGQTSAAQDMREEIISTKVANGKTKEKAEEAFADSVATSTRNAFDSGLLDEAGAEKMLLEYAGMGDTESADKVSYWSFIKAHPQYRDDLSQSNVEKYHEFAEPAEIPLDVFVQYLDLTKNLATIRDEYGEEVKSKKKQVIEVIDSLPLTRKQKNSLYLAAGYAESGLVDVPW